MPNTHTEKHDPDAALTADQLYAKYKPMAQSIAACYRDRGAPMLDRDDHLEAALHGLVEATRRWNPAHSKFTTFASRYCRGFVLNQIRAASSIGSVVFDQFGRMSDAENVCIQNGLSPSDENVAEVMSKYTERRGKKEGYVTVPVTPDRVNDWRKTLRLAEPLPLDVQAPDVSLDLDLAVEVRKAMETVAPNVRRMLEQRMEGETLKAIGAECGVSGQTVHNYTEAAMAHLREVLAPVAREYGYA